jgi:hypothetical protein
VPLGKVESPGDGRTCTMATMDAHAAIVKGANFYHIIPDVQIGDQLCTCDDPSNMSARCVIEWSHVTYCDCPESQR